LNFISRLLVSCLSVVLGRSPLVVKQYVEYAPQSKIVESKNQARAKPAGVYRLADGTAIIASARGAQTWTNFELRQLPKTGATILVSRPRRKAVIRLFFIPGYGADISTIVSLRDTLKIFEELSSQDDSKDDRVNFIRTNFGDWVLPYEIVAFDLPGVGSGPPLGDQFKTGVAWSQYIADVIKEVNHARPMQNVVVTRSASGSLALVAKELGAPIDGVNMASPTFPDDEVIRENKTDIRRAEEEKEYVPNWELLSAYFAAIKDPDFLRLLKKSGKSVTRVQNLIGSEDGQTSQKARELWERLLKARPGNELFRRQNVIAGTGHFVYSPPASREPESLSFDSPDIIALTDTVRFINYIYGGAGLEMYPTIP
jgi:pimeloyl-ACP methyl ester carboxylesterase